MSVNQPDVALDNVASRSSEDGRGGWPWFGRPRWILLYSGLIAGAVAFGIGEKTHDLVPVEEHPTNLQGSTVMQSEWKDRAAAATKNGALTYGVLGLCLGAGLGIAGGLARRSTPRTAGAGVLGAVLGAGLGGGLAWWTLLWFLKARDNYTDLDLLVSLGMHASLWGMLGAWAGLAFAIGLGDYRRIPSAMISGLIGAALGALAYDFIGAAVLPLAATDEPLAVTWVARLLACVLVSLGAALAVAAVGLPVPAPADEPGGAGSSRSAPAPEAPVKDSSPPSGGAPG